MTVPRPAITALDTPRRPDNGAAVPSGARRAPFRGFRRSLRVRDTSARLDADRTTREHVPRGRSGVFLAKLPCSLAYCPYKNTTKAGVAFARGIHQGTAAQRPCPHDHEEFSAGRWLLAASLFFLAGRPDLLSTDSARNPSSRSALEPAARSAELRLEPSSGRVLAIAWRWTNTHTTRTDASRDHPMFTESLATAPWACTVRGR